MSTRSRWLIAVFMLAAAVLFYFENRPALRGYFSDDDLATMAWAPVVGSSEYMRVMLSPKFSEANARPVGLIYYHFLGRAFSLTYPPYVIVLEAVHILNVWLLFYLLNSLGFSRITATAGALFYGFNAAIMEAWWKPMYVFDLLCGALCLAALLLYVRGHWLLALIPFWLAYKSKEIAVMLPIALLAWEFLLGTRKWKRLVPYFLISLNFGLQAIWHNRSIPQGGAYSLEFTPQVVMAAVHYYSSAALSQPDLWVVVLLLPLLIRDRRLTLGVILAVVILMPLLFLRDHAFSVYWYVPMIGLAIAFAAIADRVPAWAVILFFVLWLPWQFGLLRDKRHIILAEGDRTRQLLAALRNYAKQTPPVRAVVYKNVPPRVHSWGVDGAIAQVFGRDVFAAWVFYPNFAEAFAKVPMARISFDPVTYAVKGFIRTRLGNESYVRFTDNLIESQFGTGWWDLGQPATWIAPRAEATFYRPANATDFEIVAFVPQPSLDKLGPSQVTVLENGHSLGTLKLSEERAQTMHWKLPTGEPGDKHISIIATPVRRGGPEDPRDLGIAVWALGYIPIT